MSTEAGRNDLCPCGSGKKMKACHPNGYTGTSSNRKIMLIGIGVAVVAITAVAMTRDDSAAPLQAGSARQTPAAPVSNSPAPVSQGAGTPQPGPAPPGKVWSTEHGHWHDEPGAGAASTNPGVQVAPGQTQELKMPSTTNPSQVAARPNTPQPDGPVPEGKVWDVAHGHWHDAPKTAPATPATATPPK